VDYTEYYELTDMVIIGSFIFLLLSQGLVKNLKKDLREEDFKIIENELKNIKNISELLRIRFISTIEIFNDGICFEEQEGMSFGTDKFIEISGMDENYFSNQNYMEKIHRDDLHEYEKIIERISRKNPIYNTTYRIKKNDEYIWIREKGKLIEFMKNKMRISIIKKLDPKQFPETEIDVLNNLPDYSKLYTEIKRLNKSKKHFYLVIIQLSNIPSINEKYGRDFGDLMMGEYLSKLQYKFIKESNSLFRLEGIKFGLIIKDKMKYNILDRALIGTGDLVNMEMMFGGVKQTIYPNIGIVECPYEGKEPDLILSEALHALDVTLKDNYSSSYYFHR